MSEKPSHYIATINYNYFQDAVIEHLDKLHERIEALEQKHWPFCSSQSGLAKDCHICNPQPKPEKQKKLATKLKNEMVANITAPEDFDRLAEIAIKEVERVIDEHQANCGGLIINVDALKCVIRKELI